MANTVKRIEKPKIAHAISFETTGSERPRKNSNPCLFQIGEPTEPARQNRDDRGSQVSHIGPIATWVRYAVDGTATALASEPRSGIPMPVRFVHARESFPSEGIYVRCAAHTGHGPEYRHIEK